MIGKTAAGSVLAVAAGGENDGAVCRSLLRPVETRLEIRIKSPTYFDAPPPNPGGTCNPY
jgi:hypothetical protein